MKQLLYVLFLLIITSSVTSSIELKKIDQTSINNMERDNMFPPGTNIEDIFVEVNLDENLRFAQGLRNGLAEYDRKDIGVLCVTISDIDEISKPEGFPQCTIAVYYTSGTKWYRDESIFNLKGDYIYNDFKKSAAIYFLKLMMKNIPQFGVPIERDSRL